MLYRLLGVSAFLGLATMLLMAPSNGVIAKQLIGLQKEMMRLKDSRTKVMNEILNGMRVIKFFAWEDRYDIYIS